MRKKQLLSFEAKFILGVILIIALIILPIEFYQYFNLVKKIVIDYYKKYIDIYPLWTQFAVLFSPILIYIIIVQIRKNRCDYKKDFIYGVKWKWEWYGKEVIDLQCFCPNCNEELYYNIHNSSDENLTIGKFDFICDKCDKVVASIPNSNSSTRSSNNIKTEIERVIKKRLTKR
ncbi:hypothetical protein CRV08_06390 [Halarcobacter ebronensis]|uniref:Uncharacterized protein n=1 Tax=Halarcobacter ebronensis TaxID=1462615 RepID=A0A4Q0YDC9_9BACT|nr:hypothetical protein [Halarcobacter ebronensis]RXJ68456.1 hypothetical protein CRV08_06390 [Halarcobacter ebronensis]